MIDQSESSILESRVMTPDSQVSEIQNSSFSRTGSGGFYINQHDDHISVPRTEYWKNIMGNRGVSINVHFF